MFLSSLKRPTAYLGKAVQQQREGSFRNAQIRPESLRRHLQGTPKARQTCDIDCHHNSQTRHFQGAGSLSNLEVSDLHLAQAQGWLLGRGIRESYMRGSKVLLASPSLREISQPVDRRLRSVRSPFRSTVLYVYRTGISYIMGFSQRRDGYG